MKLTIEAREAAREISMGVGAFSVIACKALAGYPEAVAILNEYAEDLAAEES